MGEIMKNAKDTLAGHIQWDIAELNEYRYQPSRTTKPIYNIGDDYLACIGIKQKAPQSNQRNADEWFWEDVKVYDQFKVIRRLTEDEIYERGLA